MFDRADAIAARLKAPLRLALAVLLSWVVLDVLLYRSGLAYRVADPKSNVGAVVDAMMLVAREHRAQARNVLVFGDSRVAEGFSARIAEAGRDDVNFINVAVPGSTPRTWYYLLRAIDHAGYDYDAVVLGTWIDPRPAERWSEWPLDPAHQAPLLRIGDLPNYAASFDSATMRARAWRAILLPAVALQHDTRALLASPLQRLRQLRKVRPRHLANLADYAGRPGTLPLLDIDAGGQVRDWGSTDPALRAPIEEHLASLRRRVDADLLRANFGYLERWYGALAHHAELRGATVLLLPLPRGPYREALPPIPLAIDTLARHDNVRALPASLAQSLERPHYFFDALHLNAAGRAQFSPAVGEQVRAALETAGD